MKTKNLFSSKVLLLSLGCFLFAVHSSHGMWEQFWEKYAKAKADEAAQQEAAQRQRDRTDPGSQAISSETAGRTTLSSGTGPAEIIPESFDQDAAINIIIGSYFQNPSLEEHSDIAAAARERLTSMEQFLKGRSKRILTPEDRIYFISETVAKKAGVPPLKTGAEAVAAYHQAVAELGSSLGRETLSSGNGPSERPQEEIDEIIETLQRYEFNAMVTNEPPLTEEEGIRLVAEIVAKIDARKAAAQALAQEQRRQQEEANQARLAAQRGVTLAQQQNTLQLSTGSNSYGSTSGEEGSPHSTPEKVTPLSAAALSEVERLQEEVRLAKEEMDRAEDFWKNAEKRYDEAHKKKEDAIRQSSNPSYYASEKFTEKLRLHWDNPDMLSPEEHYFFTLRKDNLEKYNIFAYKEKENAQAYSLARNHYLDLEKQLYIAHKKANPSLTHSLILALCERHIPFLLHEIGRTEERLLKYESYIGSSGKRYPDCERELSQIKEHIPNLWNHYLFLVGERYDTKPSFIRPSTPYVPSTAEQTELTKLKQQLVAKQHELSSHREVVSQLEQQEQKVNSDLTNNTKALQKFKTDHPYGAGFGILKSSLNLLTEQGNLEKWYNYSLRAKQDFDRISKPKLQAAREAIDKLASLPSYLRIEIETLEHKLTKYPEERITPLEEAFFRQWPLQEQFNRYWHALNALITFDDSLPRMYDDLKYEIISREAEEHYKTYAPILITSKTSLLSPQEQGHPERFVAHGMSASEIVKLAIKRKKEYDSHEAFMKRSCGGTINCFATTYTPIYTREQQAQDWWRREGQQQAIRQRQAANTAWNIQQNYMVQNAIINGNLYFPLYK